MTTTSNNASRDAQPKRAYQAPRLRRLGTFADMTRTTTTSTIVPQPDYVADTYYVS